MPEGSFRYYQRGSNKIDHAKLHLTLRSIPNIIDIVICLIIELVRARRAEGEEVEVEEIELEIRRLVCFGNKPHG
jgi:hypothetical protein